MLNLAGGRSMSRWLYGVVVLVVLLGQTWRPDPQAAEVFHVGAEASNPPPARAPLRFPFDLQGGQGKEAAAETLQRQGLDRDSFDSNFTAWSIPGKIHYKSFKPAGLTLHYRGDRLMQVNLIQPEMLDCAEVAAMIDDAVAMIQEHYLVDLESIRKAPHFGTGNCFFFMKPGNVGWQASEGDYAVNVDVNWRDEKYSGYVTFTDIPVYQSH